MNSQGSDESLPSPKINQKPTRNLAWVWLIPLVVAIISLSILWKQWSSRGPTVEISFLSANGLLQGKTQIRFRDVIIGTVTEIKLSESRNSVIVTAQLNKDAQGLANDKAQFWVVKPSIGINGVSGLSTLFSGAYIEVDSSDLSQKKATKFEFVGLEKPPPIASDKPGSRFHLRTKTLGSIESGTPIYFLRIPVGVVTDYKLEKDGKHIDINVFINAPYDKYVNGSTRFWDESGVHMGVGPNGVDVSVGSLASLLSSGIAFASFGPNKPVAQDQVFTLFPSRENAKMLPQGPAVPIEMRFDQATRGLAQGAMIDFHGVHVGILDSVRLDIDPKTRTFYTVATGTIYPAMLGSVFTNLPAESKRMPELGYLIESNVKRGLRAQLRQTSLISSGLYVQLVYEPNYPLNVPLNGQLPIRIPTIPSQTIDQLQEQIASIIREIGKVPFEKIGAELQSALKQFAAMTKTLDKTLSPEFAQTMKKLQASLDAMNRLFQETDPLPGQIAQSINQLDRTLRSTRQLMDELKDKPDSVIFGAPAPSYSRDTLGSGSR